MSASDVSSSNPESPGYWPHLGLSGLPKAVIERITDFNNPKQNGDGCSRR